MSATVFVDTNVLLYATSDAPDEAAKTEAALRVLEQPGVALSVQVLTEFYVNATHPKKPRPMSHTQALRFLSVWRGDRVQEMTVPVLERGLAIRERYLISLWDALIISAASELGCQTVYTEDLNDGQDYAGVRARNPFAAK
jgi:predicted nucleic acid-binding protein